MPPEIYHDNWRGRGDGTYWDPYKVLDPLILLGSPCPPGHEGQNRRFTPGDFSAARALCLGRGRLVSLCHVAQLHVLWVPLIDQET